MFYFDSVFVAPAASLWMPDTNFIIVFGKIQNEGLMDMRGHFDIIGNMAGSGATVMHGIFHNFGELTMGPGSTIQVDGDLVNEGIITGEGAICISSLTYNNGLLSGFIDFCDLSPSTTSNPIIDVYSGTVTDNVTYCTNTFCASGWSARSIVHVEARPVPAIDRVELILPATARPEIVDPQGRKPLVYRERHGDRVILWRGDLPDGVYLVRALDKVGDIVAYTRIVFTSR